MQRTPALVLAPIVLCLFHSASGVANGDFTLTTLASFNGANGSEPYGNVIVDAAGNLYGTTNSGGSDNKGTVFEIAKGNNSVTTLASFNGANGSVPFSGVTLDANGNLYGTTYSEGAGGYGTVYEIAKGSNTLTTLANFNFANGARPYGGVTLDSNGNLYGTTVVGGSGGGNGTVFEIAKGSNTVTTLASFNIANGAYSYSGVTLDSNGNLYGTTNYGGVNNAGTVFEIVKGSNTLTTLASFGVAGNYPQSGVTLDANGNLYGTTGGGSNGYGTVFMISKGSNIITTVASFDGANGFSPAAGVTFDAAGNLYGTADLGGPFDAGTVFEIARGSNTITTLATFNGTTTGAGPYGGVTLDADGNLFGATVGGGANGDGTVYELSPTVVPEPASMAMLAMGTLMAGGWSIRSARSRRVVGLAHA